MTTTTPSQDYRDLVADFADMAPDAHGFKAIEDLPELSAEDLELIARVKGTAVRQALLADIRAECERRIEAAHERELEAFYGSSSPQSERERLTNLYGVTSLFRRTV